MTKALTFSDTRRGLGKFPAIRQPDHRWPPAPVRLATAVMVAAIAAGAASVGAAQATSAPAMGKAPGQAQIVGVFTGECANGAPVYRLPAVTVVASRKSELPGMARDQRTTRARHASTGVAAGWPCGTVECASVALRTRAN